MAQFELFGYITSSIVFQNTGDFTFTPPVTPGNLDASVNPLDGNTVDLSTYPGRAIFPVSANASFYSDQPILLYDVYYSGAGTLNIGMMSTDSSTIIPITSITDAGSRTRLNQFIPANAIVVITSSGGGSTNRVEITGKQAKSDASV